MQTLVFWHWLILAGALLILELMAPGAFMLWLAMAAGASALVALVLPDLSWQVQLGLFSFFCILSVVGWKKFAPAKDAETDQPTLNQRNRQYIGRVFDLAEAIENGVGKVIIGDTQWKVHGPDTALGGKVKVVDVDGTILLVEPVE